ncbi:MAG: hypothetical protein R3D00_28770 [Bacteroidia bacterium]
MNTYVNQLCEDLRSHHGKFPTLPNIRAISPYSDFPDFMEGPMMFLFGPKYEMADLFEISPEAFPPVEKLSAEHIRQISDAILGLWESLNIYADLPKGVPAEKIYQQLVHKWAESPIPVLPFGQVHLEFCDYESSDCPWGDEYCRCKRQRMKDKKIRRSAKFRKHL